MRKLDGGIVWRPSRAGKAEEEEIREGEGKKREEGAGRAACPFSAAS